MGRYRGDEPDLIDKIKKLEDRISRLERTPQASNTGVNTSGIFIRGGGIFVSRDMEKPFQIHITDAFSRVTANGWGKTENGSDYTITDGPTSAFYTDNNNGIMAIPTLNTSHRALLQTANQRDFDYNIEVLLTVTPTGGLISFRHDFRWIDTNNRLRLEFDVNTDSTINLTLKQILATVTTTLATVTPIPGVLHSTTIPLKIRVSAIGKTVMAKLWRLTDPEPTVWPLVSNNMDVTFYGGGAGTGAAGVSALLSSSNSNTLPVIIKWDNLSYTSPDYIDRVAFPNYGEGAINVGSDDSVNGEIGMALTVFRSNSVPGAYIDSISGLPFTGNQSMSIATVDGYVEDAANAFPSWKFKDKSGDALIGDSNAARRGFSDPIFPVTWYDPVSYHTTTSGTFSNVASSEWYMYHPHIRVRILVNNDASNTSELRLIETPALTNTLASFTTTAGYFGYVDLIAKRSSFIGGNSPNGNVGTFSVDQRRASGAATVRALVVSMVGIDLSYSQPY